MLYSLLERHDNKLEKALSLNAFYLLLKFNHIYQEIRRCADKCLSTLVDKFPQLLWNGPLLGRALDILQKLQDSLRLDPNRGIIFKVCFIFKRLFCFALDLESPKIAFNDAPIDWTLALMDTQEERRKVYDDFAIRCLQILQVAIIWAPNATRSHLQVR